ncbi:MAG: hypothetical protein GY943_26160 [Chloroflexi bacterium]|nr:hypothetical protein [Chloroflexota bacterium]
MRIVLHIDRLVLDGIELSHRDQLRLETAVVAELTSLLANNIHSPNHQFVGDQRAIQANPIQVNSNPQPDVLGRGVGTAVYGGITK